MAEIKVTAVVSAYNAEELIAGKLRDLTAQTLWPHEMEIVVVESGSSDHTWEIMLDAIQSGVDLKVIRTFRESIYAAWNRGVREAEGRYIVNANCDDRLHPQAYEKMARYLDEHQTIDLVYPDSFVTNTVNASWDHWNPSKAAPYTTASLPMVDWSPRTLMEQCYIGQTPMWRACVTADIGLFDSSYLLAGDYEYWLRMTANGKKMARLPEFLGLYYFGGSTMRNQERSDMEARRARMTWGDRIDQIQT